MTSLAMPEDEDPEDVEAILSQLTPANRADFLERYKRKVVAQEFYCARGRYCDGNPHPGANYQHARGDQWPPIGVPGNLWKYWIQMGGRGSGKTKTGSEYSLRVSDMNVEQIGIIAPTAADLRDTIVEGPSGLKKVCELAGRPGTYEPSKSRFVFDNGMVALLITAEEPDRLRGKQFGFIWMDEPAHWSKVDLVWAQAQYTLRLGSNPHYLITTTPLPTKWMKARIADPRAVLSRVSTYANKANLADDFLEEIAKEYEGTRLGRQELYGEILEDVEGALWNADMMRRADKPEDLEKIVVSIDPAGSSGKRSDETGIMVAGKIKQLTYILEDASGKYTPEQWARRAIRLYEDYDADHIVVETNYGGAMVEATIKSIDPSIPVKTVRATRNKRIRAEPIVSRYEQGKVFHVTGAKLAELETELMTWVPDSGMASPNRLDALVWAISDLQKGYGQVKTIMPRPGNLY